MKTLSVICARAGSKGLKNKCISIAGDKMVFEYPIEYSLSLGKDVKTVVSTDIDVVKDYCKKNNVACINRKSEYCLDQSKIEDTLVDAIDQHGQDSKFCSLVYGNIPTRYPELFEDALDFLTKNDDYDAVFSMQNVEKYNPAWMFELNHENLPKKTEVHYMRQGLPQLMIHDGHTILFKTDKFYKKQKGLTPKEAEFMYSSFGSKIKPLLNNNVIVDIDTERDLLLVKAVLDNKELF